MNKYQLRFWFEHGGICIWGTNSEAKEIYGYPIKSDALPISNNLIREIETLEVEYASYLDWNNPQDPSPWTKEQKADFLNRATLVCKRLRDELGSDFEILNDVSLCVD